MLDFIFIMIAFGLGIADGGESGTSAQAPAPAPAESAGLLAGTDETMAAAAPAAPSAGAYVAEAQTPTGKFTTATEIRPIMGATKSSWVAVREYDGRDLVYVTQILAWRCGLVGLRLAINGGPMQDWPLAPCQIDTATPNAIPQDAKIYESHPLKSVQSVDIEIVYDDLTRDGAHFERGQVLMP